MELSASVFGFQFTVYLGPTPDAEAEYRLGTSDHSFGFAPDPLVEPYWTDDTDG
jgi:hypothetical protein